MGFPDGPVVNNSPTNAGDARGVSLIPVLGRCPGGGSSNQLQYFFLGNPMDRGAWWATVHVSGHKDLDTTEHVHACARARTHTITHTHTHTQVRAKPEAIF